MEANGYAILPTPLGTHTHNLFDVCVCVPKGVMTRPLYIDDTAKMAPQKHEEQSQMQASKRVIAIQTPISFLND